MSNHKDIEKIIIDDIDKSFNEYCGKKDSFSQSLVGAQEWPPKKVKLLSEKEQLVQKLKDELNSRFGINKGTK